MVKTESLTYAYPKGSVLDFPNVEIDNNALILGASGGGKSTFLHLLTGITPLQKGYVTFDQNTYSSSEQSQLDKYRGQNISMIFQKPQFFPALTVMENLRVQNMARKTPISEKDATEVLEQLEISAEAHKNIKYLSVGQRQRVSIARALIAKPKWIFADEPTSALDDKNAQRVIDLLLQNSMSQKAQLIVVTHDTRLREHFDQIIQL